MPFASLSDFEKWHRSIQYRYNSVEDRALQRKQAALNRLHGPPRPNASLAGRKQKTVKNRRKLRVNGRKTRVSHIVWHDHTGHWPVWPEVIHHIDGDKTNDVFENLQLMDAADHAALHRNLEENPMKRPEVRAKISGANSPHWKGDDATPDAKYRRILRAQRRAIREL